MLAGGPAASLLLTLLFGVLRFGFFQTPAGDAALIDLRYLFSFVFLANLFQFFSTALPMRYRVVCAGLDSDGKQILNLLRDKETK